MDKVTVYSALSGKYKRLDKSYDSKSLTTRKTVLLIKKCRLTQEGPFLRNMFVYSVRVFLLSFNIHLYLSSLQL